MSMYKFKMPLLATILALFVSYFFLTTDGDAALWDTPLKFANPIKGVHTASQPISGAAWIETGEEIVVIGPLTIPRFAANRMRRTKERGGTVKYVIYTHGHGDHVGGRPLFWETIR